MYTPQEQASRFSQNNLLKQLEERDCEFCENGVFIVGSYKGNDAVICDTCGTPILQFWLDT